MYENILILVGDPIYFGFGHYIRALNIKNFIEEQEPYLRINITCINPDTTYVKLNTKYKIIILDARDLSFPQNVLEEYQAKNLLVLDNKGMGCKQSKFSLDTLPHFSMTLSDWKKSLQFFLLPPFLMNYKNQVNQSGCKVIPYLYKNKTQSNKNLLLLKKNISDTNIQKVQRDFIHNNVLKNHDCYVYFGQTLFEALYLGRQIYLYSISRYHFLLAQHFIHRWNALPLLKSYYFDGRGLIRFMDYIKNKLL